VVRGNATALMGVNASIGGCHVCHCRGKFAHSQAYCRVGNDDTLSVAGARIVVCWIQPFGFSGLSSEPRAQIAAITIERSNRRIPGIVWPLVAVVTDDDRNARPK
jgi:hypothetical protein